MESWKENSMSQMSIWAMFWRHLMMSMIFTIYFIKVRTILRFIHLSLTCIENWPY